MKPRIKEAVIVEGRYDKNTLSQVIEGTILETSGFAVFKNGEALALFRRLAQERGIVILTDSDGAGFVIRNYLKGAIDPALVKHAYIPDRSGKERRKRAPGKEGKLGVEGMDPETLLDALRRAGATFLDQEEAAHPKGRAVTKADLYAAGLSGGVDSAARRREVLKKLDLPEHLSPNAMLCVLNALYGYEELKELGIL